MVRTSIGSRLPRANIVTLLVGASFALCAAACMEAQPGAVGGATVEADTQSAPDTHTPDSAAPEWVPLQVPVGEFPGKITCRPERA